MRFDKERFKTPSPLARAIVLTADKFEDFELFVPYFRMMEEGIAVDVAAPAKETITGENGYFFENVDLTIDEVDPQMYDLLFIPGGASSRRSDDRPEQQEGAGDRARLLQDRQAGGGHLPWPLPPGFGGSGRRQASDLVLGRWRAR